MPACFHQPKLRLTSSKAPGPKWPCTHNQSTAWRPGSESRKSQIPNPLNQNQNPNRKGFKMKTFKTLLSIGVLSALVIGCQTTTHREDMLSAAGFKQVAANTPERQEHLKSLPRDK